MEESNKDKNDPQYSPDGIDMTLTRWMLSLTPEERLQTLQNHVNAVLKLRRGKRKDGA